MESARTKIESLPDEDVLVFLQGMTFAGKPTRLMVNKMQKICSIQKIAKKQRLVQACWITSSNIAKGFCKTTPVCTSWVETSILQGLQKIVTPDCYNDIESCQPIKDLSVHDVLAIAENLGRPAFLTPLEQIIFHPRMPTNVIMTAVSSCRPIIRIAPKRCQIILLRLFRDFKYDSQTRTLAFSVMMENPHPHLVQLCARQIYVEPSLNIRKYAHDVFTQCSESVLMYNKTMYVLFFHPNGEIEYIMLPMFLYFDFLALLAFLKAPTIFKGSKLLYSVAIPTPKVSAYSHCMVCQ